MDVNDLITVNFLVLQNGHVGFIMSCYDAELTYDCHTDTFAAR